MSDNEKRIYEGMFLFPQSSLSNMQEASDHIHGLLTRVEAEVVSFRKWDERRLAYEISGNKRGVYFLCYFNCDPTQIEVFERLCNQSESLLRSLVTRADHINQEEIEAADGRESLADEIKLREEEAASAKDSGDASSHVTVGGKDDAEEQDSNEDAPDPGPESKESPADAEASGTPGEDAPDPGPESKESPADAEVSEAPEEDGDDQDEPAAEATAEA
ncbi:MAG: 30S ribosomal protein S6 [Planctomycetota bacterium]|nr:30S ribosomal protein S6 [Planctomycetota bacterium]